MSHATVWRATLRDALLAARKDRDVTRVSALRSALSAIDNAEIRELVRAEIDERLAAASSIDTTHSERAASLRAEAAVLTDLLGDV
jgi:uncharacterized protein YqeY